MRVLGGNERALLEKTGTQTERKHPVPQSKRRSVRIIYCQNCFNFSTAIQADLIYSIVKHQNVKLRVTSKCIVCHTEILGFVPPGEPKNREHSTKKLGTKLHCPRVGAFLNNPIGADTKNVPCAYQQFLFDWKLEQGDHVTFNFALESFSIEKLNSKLNDVFSHLKYAAKVNVAFGFVMKNIDDSRCRFVYPQGKNSMLGKYKLLITGDDLKHFKAMIAAKNVKTACTRGMVDTKWQFLKLTNGTVFAVLLKNIPMCCRNAVLPDHLLKERFINCITFNQKLL